jgi:hypothetical protein
MSTLELDRLEEDVAKARQRVVADVARLRSPTAFAEFKDDIGHTFSDTAQRTMAGRPPTPPPCWRSPPGCCGALRATRRSQAF